MNPHTLGEFFRHKGVLMILHVLIMLLSAWLIFIISVDTFKDISFYEQHRFLKQQFWICMLFMADFFIELILASDKKNYLRTHFIFFLVAIPYQFIIYHFGLSLSKEVEYLVRYIPLVRGGYAMAIVVSWFTYNRATTLFFSYIITLLSTVYFASLTFYLFEYKVNPEVQSYQDALWWAAMNVTTVGCNVIAITPVGKILSVVLAALGMMMFPIFTVYVTNVITRRNKQAADGMHDDNLAWTSAFRQYEANQKKSSGFTSQEQK